MSAADRLGAALTRRPEHPMLVDAAGERTITYGEGVAAAARIATELAERGVARGDRIVVALPNSAELALLYLAALSLGAVVVPIGGGFGRRAIRDVLARTEPTLAVVEEGDSPAAAVAAEREVTRVTVEALRPWEGSVTPDLALPADDELVSVHFTSGSTGQPRGVAHRFGDFVANGARYAEAAGLDGDARFHHTLPMTYMAGYYNLLLLPFGLGATVVLDRAFDARTVLRFWDVPVAHDTTVLWLVPTICAMLLKVDRGDAGERFCRERVLHAACGTAPLDPDVKLAFEARYGTALHDCYGLSETLLSTASTRTAPAGPGQVGRPLPGVELRAGVGEDGPVLIRCADTTPGYLERWPTAAAAELRPVVDADGWLNTGDIGRLDDDGQLAITGRQKDVIIRGGVNIAAVEVERALRGPGDEHVAVVGVPHEILGEQVVAVVAGGAPFETLEPELRARAQEALPEAQRPNLYLQIDALPVTPTGKVRKGVLRDLLIDRLGLPARGKGFTRDEAEDAAPAAAAPGPIDLTHPLFEGMVSFPSPNHPTPEVRQLAHHATEGRATRRLVLGTHTGTHADAPLHFIPGGETIDRIDLARLVGPAQVADLTPVTPLEEIGLERLKAALGGAPRHPRVLLRFDWDKRFVDLGFYHESPHLTEEACRWLVEQGVDVIGMDIPSPDDPRNDFASGNDSPNHQILLGAGVVLLEYLANLDRIAGDEVFLVALPLPVVGGDGAPMRVIALPPGTVA